MTGRPFEEESAITTPADARPPSDAPPLSEGELEDLLARESWDLLDVEWRLVDFLERH